MAPRKRKTAKTDTSSADTTPDYDSMKVAELRKACEEAGLDTKGAKAALIKRLKGGDGGPPAKLVKEESENSKIRRILTEDIGKSKKPAKAKVDQQVPLSLVSVLDDYDCMLNQTNINKNNNKYYIIQLLTLNSSFWTWNRWGRVGETGANSLKAFGSDKAAAVKDFEKKFQDKTRNKWANRENFEPVPGKYTMLEMTGEDDDDDVEVKDEPDAGSPKKPLGKTLACTLDEATRRFVKLIFDQDMFKDAMKSMEIDVKKMPLGKLSKLQIAKGFEALVALEDAIKNNKSSEFDKLTSRFYTLIPHDFGRSRPPIISDVDMVRKKKDMLLVLSDIEIAQSMQKEGPKDVDSGLQPHPLDVSYKSLACSMDHMNPKDKEYKIMCDYIKATGPGHLKLLDMWKINRELEDDRFKAHESIANRKLLWHGTNVAVVAAIMKTGLRIMPHSGGRVGKGIYFASENSKSAGYVRPTGRWGATCAPDEENIGVMFLAEVALGKEKHISRDDSSLKAAPPGYDSIIARGQTEPDPAKDTSITINGKKVTVPQGKPVNQPSFSKSSFWQSEYLVYKESQVHLRYMLKLKFYETNGW